MNLNEIDDSVRSTLQSIGLNDIQEVEEKYKFQFPREMKEFYLKYNGGKVNADEVVTDDFVYDFHVFYSIKYGKNILEKKLYLYDFGNSDYIYPEFLVPFACDSGGNDYLFSLKKGKEGAIYFIDHESYENEDDIFYICENIEKFIMLLR